MEFGVTTFWFFAVCLQVGDQARKQCLYSKHIKRDVECLACCLSCACGRHPTQQLVSFLLQVGKLKALTAADVTKRKQEQFERQRDEKAVSVTIQKQPWMQCHEASREAVQASWAAKYEEERRQEAKLRHETRLVQKILGDMPT